MWSPESASPPKVFGNGGSSDSQEQFAYTYNVSQAEATKQEHSQQSLFDTSC